MPRRPKFRGKVIVKVEECPTCGGLMMRQVKSDMTGKEYRCSQCDEKPQGESR